MTMVRFALVAMAITTAASRAEAQSLGTFRWQTAPFCNVLTLTVTQSGGVFTLHGFDEQCGGNLRLPLHGIAVPQPDGTITLGLNVVQFAGGQPVSIEAGISLATLGGTWRDSAGHVGTLVFGAAPNGGVPRPGPIQPPPIPATFSLSPNGNFVVAAGAGSDTLPTRGRGTRMVWDASRSAFRAGFAVADEWNQERLGRFSAAFGNGADAVGLAAFAAGIDVTAGGNGSVALGHKAFAERAGSFAFGDSSPGQLILTSGADQFKVRASGGVFFHTNATLSAGLHLAAGGSQWLGNSDVNLKEHFSDLDGDEVLSKIARMPVPEWSYKAQGPSIRHVGPTAQDFHAAFGLGEDPLRIGTLDADGVNFAAVKALEARTRSMEAEIAALRARIAEMERKQQ